ncbi:hypothetical protein [Deinococcus yavapaiensis]|uniref:hypothetical protein n=1 Tax=Deinococcus yavapaiensis TaxID=309889 RepID=UPI000DA1778B|nr:hypothetical protein [Deinococcus yavapaiensis]
MLVSTFPALLARGVVSAARTDDAFTRDVDVVLDHAAVTFQARSDAALPHGADARSARPRVTRDRRRRRARPGSRRCCAPRNSARAAVSTRRCTACNARRSRSNALHAAGVARGNMRLLEDVRVEERPNAAGTTPFLHVRCSDVFAVNARAAR